MVIARVTFLSPERGGRTTPPLPGYHPQVAIGDESTSCAIESLEGEAAFTFDRDHLVSLRLLLPEHYPDAFAIGQHIQFIGQHIQFYEGSHLVGSGTILDIR